eukprot:CAMPEP_0170778770 /NCGR_PEP_ID=MMETSP0733-20121128/12588_1 /TAXON_ID=186038 /ORGANISM="Fragilariopsis kerguelensis, Strain L26-C5" /LENGTH=209 /DNA_ID=CAMNT_0011122255 /DNA_START=133 /DNA_END=762 /DNA_ORIENTATION=+
MKLLLIPSLYNNALIAVTTFLVVVVLPPQESFAFRHDLGSSSASSSASSDTYHIPLNDGDVVVRTLQVRGGSESEGDLNLIANDDDSDHTYTNIAGITMDDSFRGGGQYQHRDTSTTISRHNGGFVKRSNNLARRIPRRRRLRDIRSKVNQAYNNYLVRFYWSQVTKGCSLDVPDNNNPSDTDALLAVQVRGGADVKKNQNHNVVKKES